MIQKKLALYNPKNYNWLYIAKKASVPYLERIDDEVQARTKCSLN
jgi:hypothetical protein